MIRTLAATLVVVGLALAVISGNATLAGIGVALLALGAVILLRHPEYLEH